MTKDNLSIKIATPNDWETFKTIRLEAFKEEPAAFSTLYEEASTYKDTYWKDMLEDENNIILISYFDGKPVGLIRAALKDEDVAPDTAYVGSLYVHKDFRGKGIGKMLFNRLIEEVSKHSEINFLRLWVNEEQTTAINLYQTLGFKLVDKAPNKEDPSVTELVFEMSL
jgi:ribosomal protein S18 acetylase RimI-like enzyme